MGSIFLHIRLVRQSAGWATGLALVLGLATGCTSGLTATSPAMATAIPAPVLAVAATPQPTYWPAETWRTSTPEEQGVDSARLAEMFGAIRQQRLNLDSVLIIRHGYIVAEIYYPPYQPDTKHPIYSITKSIISALVGVALDEGYLPDLDQPALDFFTATGRWQPADNDPRKGAITLKHLLTMTSGFRWTEADNRQLFSSADPIQWTLDRPMVAEPGTAWLYNSGSTHLLSAILQEATGQNAAAFAQSRLFQPLGISDVYWPSDANGINTGGSGIEMTPRDLAKFGYLYLHGGKWDGQQVVPADWVRTSTQTLVKSDDGRGYGYLWWQLSFGGYAALGYGGQEIIVLPDRDLLIVFTSTPLEEQKLWQLVAEYVIPAVQSAEPLPPNPKGQERLAAELKAVAQSR